MNENAMKNHAQACLLAMLGEKLVNDWWNSKNAAFDNQTPAGEWIRNPKRVYDYIMLHAYGGW
jgi:hypothetical protein